MKSCQNYFSTCLLGIAALLVGASTAFAAAAPPLGTAGDYVVLSAPLSGGAVSTTASTITGNVGSSGAVSLTDTTITGNVVLTGVYTQVPAAPPNAYSGSLSTPLPTLVVTDFEAAFTALNQTCTNTIPTAAFTGVPLSVGSGVTCFPAAVTFTNSVLTLTGNGPWILRVGAALTGTSMRVVMANGGNACNVFWQVQAAATMTTSVFQGNILAGAAITTTGGTFAGRALARAGVTMTGTVVVGCDALPPGLGLVCDADERLVCKKKHRHDDEDDCKNKKSFMWSPFSKCSKDDWRDHHKPGDKEEGKKEGKKEGWKD